MEILFKDDYWLYYNDRFLTKNRIINIPNINLFNIRHLDDVEPLYHYIGIDGEKYPVYFERDDKFVSKLGNYYIVTFIEQDYIKDYTLVNLKLL